VNNDLPECRHPGIVLEFVLCPIAHVDEIGIRKGHVPHMALAQFHAREHQPVGIFVGKGLQ